MSTLYSKTLSTGEEVTTGAARDGFIPILWGRPGFPKTYEKESELPAGSTPEEQQAAVDGVAARLEALFAE